LSFAISFPTWSQQRSAILLRRGWTIASLPLSLMHISLIDPLGLWTYQMGFSMSWAVAINGVGFGYTVTRVEWDSPLTAMETLRPTVIADQEVRLEPQAFREACTQRCPMLTPFVI